MVKSNNQIYSERVAKIRNDRLKSSYLKNAIDTYNKLKKMDEKNYKLSAFNKNKELDNLNEYENRYFNKNSDDDFSLDDILDKKFGAKLKKIYSDCYALIDKLSV